MDEDEAVDELCWGSWCLRCGALACCASGYYASGSYLPTQLPGASAASEMRGDFADAGCPEWNSIGGFWVWVYRIGGLWCLIDLTWTCVCLSRHWLYPYVSRVGRLFAATTALSCTYGLVLYIQIFRKKRECGGSPGVAVVFVMIGLGMIALCVCLWCLLIDAEDICDTDSWIWRGCCSCCSMDDYGALEPEAIKNLQENSDGTVSSTRKIRATYGPGPTRYGKVISEADLGDEEMAQLHLGRVQVYRNDKLLFHADTDAEVKRWARENLDDWSGVIVFRDDNSSRS